MVRLGDTRGWLHIFEIAAIETLLKEGLCCPPDMAARRPALRFALEENSRANAALLAERLFWEQLDAVRIKRDDFHGEWNYSILPNEKIG